MALHYYFFLKQHHNKEYQDLYYPSILPMYQLGIIYLELGLVDLNGT